MNSFLIVLIIVIIIPISISFLSKAFWMIFYQARKQGTLLPISQIKIYNIGWVSLIFLALGYGLPLIFISIFQWWIILVYYSCSMIAINKMKDIEYDLLRIYSKDLLLEMLIYAARLAQKKAPNQGLAVFNKLYPKWWLELLYSDLREEVTLKLGRIFKQRIFAEEKDNKKVEIDQELLNSIRSEFLINFINKENIKTYAMGKESLRIRKDG